MFLSNQNKWFRWNATNIDTSERKKRHKKSDTILWGAQLRIDPLVHNIEYGANVTARIDKPKKK